MSSSRAGAVRALVFAVWLAATPLATAAGPDVGDTLDRVTIDDCGEMGLDGARVTYRPWSAQGRPALVNFMAARVGLSEMNEPVVRKLLGARPELAPLTVTLLDTQDAMWGTQTLVMATIERRKRHDPRVRMVLDCTGEVGDQWQLPEATAVLLLLDAEGEVRFVNVGETSDERMSELLAAVDSLGLSRPRRAKDTSH